MAAARTAICDALQDGLKAALRHEGRDGLAERVVQDRASACEPKTWVIISYDGARYDEDRSTICRAVWEMDLRLTIIVPEADTWFKQGGRRGRHGGARSISACLEAELELLEPVVLQPRAYPAPDMDATDWDGTGWASDVGGFVDLVADRVELVLDEDVKAAAAAIEAVYRVLYQVSPFPPAKQDDGPGDDDVGPLE